MKDFFENYYFDTEEEVIERNNKYLVLIIYDIILK